MIKAWFDGVCEPKNPGGFAAYGIHVEVDGAVVARRGAYVGNGPLYSNNVAEYSGFIAAAKECLNHEGPIEIRGDSALVINQLRGKWRVNGGLYYPYYVEASDLWAMLRERGQLFWIPRQENEICDVLSKQVLKDMGVKFRIQREDA